MNINLRSEMRALNIALRWVKADPHYEGDRPTRREYELMRLALRCYTSPVASEIALLRLEAVRES